MNPVPTPSPASWWSASRWTNSRWRSTVLSCIPVVRISSPPESQGVGSSSSVMCTQRTGSSRPASPASTRTSMSCSSSLTVSIGRSGPVDVHAFAGLAQHGSEHRLDLFELLGTADQRRRELDHRVAAVIGAADQPAAEELDRQEPAQQRLGLGVGERLLRVPVLDQ